jgi:hypothetical protein
MNELYGHGVRITPDTRLVEVRREGNKLAAVLANAYSGARAERIVDQVVGDHGTLANDELYFALKPHSSNLGETDLRAMAEAAPQTLVNNPDGAFQLFRIGDAWTSRNIHAAMLDAMRICVTL